MVEKKERRTYRIPFLKIGTRHYCSPRCTSRSSQDCSANGSQMAADGWYSQAPAPPNSNFRSKILFGGFVERTKGSKFSRINHPLLSLSLPPPFLHGCVKLSRGDSIKIFWGNVKWNPHLSSGRGNLDERIIQ